MTAGSGSLTRTAALLTLALALPLTACTTNEGKPTDGSAGTAGTGARSSSTSVGSTQPAATTGSPSPTSVPSGPPTRDPRGLAVYWIGESRGSYALFREFRNVPDHGGPIVSAVMAMTRMRPLDPDYTTPWRPVDRVKVTQHGQALTVDLPRAAIASTMVGTRIAELAVQQLVYTAVDAAAWQGTPVSSVAITIDGGPAVAWGSQHLGQPVVRAPEAAVLSHAWVTTPQEGDRVPAGTVTFSGYGTSFEATFHWRIMRSDGGRVAEGSVMGGTGTGGFGKLTWTVRLAPGSYIVRLATDDPSGGEAPGGPAVDTKTFVVR